MTKAEFFALCLQAGFQENECSLEGESADDERVCVDEYPIGERLLRLAKLLGIEVDG